MSNALTACPDGKKCRMINFIACILHLKLLRAIKSRKMRWVGHTARKGTGDVFRGF
jgi:hypothetical protein